MIPTMSFVRRGLVRPFLLASAAALLAAPLAAAQPMPLARRTAGILVGDTGLDAVYLVRDLPPFDGDTNDPGEVTIFFDASNASGLGAASGQVLSIFQSCDGSVYIGDNDTDTVYALRDNNGDGDANDAGEARVWFTGTTNAGGYGMASPNGIAADSSGAIYILTAGTTSIPARAIYRTVDTDGLAGANGLGEATVWADLSTLVVPAGSSSAFELSFIGDTAYFMDLRGMETDAIMRAVDSDNTGVVEPDEFNTFLTNGDHGVATGFSCATDGVSIYVHENLGSTDHSIFRLTDGDASDTINMSDEAVEVWNASASPVAIPSSNSFAIAVGPGGDIAFATSSGTRVIERLHDDVFPNLSFLDPGETTLLITGASGVFPSAARSLCFYANPCRADFDRNCVVAIPDIFFFLSRWFAQDPFTDVDESGTFEVSDVFGGLAIWFGGC